jgi:hypothetical protein
MSVLILRLSWFVDGLRWVRALRRTSRRERATLELATFADPALCSFGVERRSER